MMEQECIWQIDIYLRVRKYAKYFPTVPKRIEGRRKCASMTFYINAHQKDSYTMLAASLEECIRNYDRGWEELVFICIGTDRITGDSLGPYVGYCLSECPFVHGRIYGTLEHPVHALNLEEVMGSITRRHPHGLYVAVDASLGMKKHLGFVTVTDGALHPGAGVKKELPPVGHIAITGIVNASGWMEHLALQTTRLSTVVAMADMITRGILRTFHLLGYTATASYTEENIRF